MGLFSVKYLSEIRKGIMYTSLFITLYFGFLLSACSVNIGNPFSDGDSGKSKEKVEIKNSYSTESAGKPSNITGGYLVCSRPTRASLSDPISRVGCGFRNAEESSFVVLKDSVDRWELSSSFKQGVTIKAQEVNSLQYPIDVSITGDIDLVNEYTSNMILAYTLSKGAETEIIDFNHAVIYEGAGSGVSQSIDGIPEFRLHASIVEPLNQGTIKIGLTYAEVDTGNKVNFGNLSPIYTTLLSDGAISSGADPSVQGETGVQAYFESTADEALHQVLVVSGASDGVVQNELKVMLIDVKVNDQSFGKVAPLIYIEFQLGTKTYNFDSSFYDRLPSAADHCAAWGGEPVKIDSDELNGKLKAIAWASRKSLWLGVEDPDDDNVYKWLDGSDLSYSSWENGQPAATYNDSNARCGLMTARGGWQSRPCNWKRSIFCQK